MRAKFNHKFEFETIHFLRRNVLTNEAEEMNVDFGKFAYVDVLNGPNSFGWKLTIHQMKGFDRLKHFYREDHRSGKAPPSIYRFIGITAQGEKFTGEVVPKVWDYTVVQFDGVGMLALNRSNENIIS